MARHTRNRRVQRRKTRKQKQKGGGRLDKLPVGPDSRKADGTPSAGFSAAVNLEKRRTAFNTLTAMTERRGNFPALTNNAKYADHLKKFAGALPAFVYRTVLDPDYYLGRYANLATRLPEGTGVTLNDPLDSDSLVAAVKNDFEKNWDFMYLMGHGVLAPELPPAEVPARTYVRFNAPGGCRAVVGGSENPLDSIMSFSDTFTRSYDIFLDKMTEHYFKNTGPLESFNSLAERTATAAMPYPPEYCTTPRNLFSESTAASCLVNPLQKKQTIYGPGEKVQEMKINFSNNPNQMLMIGLYTLPILEDYAASLADFDHHLRASHKPSHEMTEAEFTDAIASQQHNDAAWLINGINIKPDWILRQYSLTQIFRELPPVPAGKVRFLFINACRGVPFTLADTGLVSDLYSSNATAAATRRLNIPSRQELAARARRASLAVNSGTEDALEKLLEARRYMRNVGMTGPRYAEMKAIDDDYAGAAMDPTKGNARKAQAYQMALTLIPLN